MKKLPHNVLLMDTSMPQGVVGFVSNGHVCAEVYLTESRRHGEQLAATLKTVLHQAQKTFSDIDGIVIGTGPGSFVGVRVAMSTGKGIGLARQIPVWGVSTLSALAFQVQDHNAGTIIALIDARRSQGYVQSFNFKHENVIAKDPQAIDPEDLPAYCAAVDLVVGNGLFLLDEAASADIAKKALLGPSALGLWDAFKARCREGLPHDEIHHLVPQYIRSPDAKLPKIAPDYSLTSS
jgi:tRNA threonylcarbamoyladenosine biosynthesis protein TsaB